MVAEPLRDIPDADAVRPQPITLDIGPGDRDGDWRSSTGSHSIWRDRRLRVGVAVDVEEEASFALLLGELGGQVIRVGSGQPLGDGIGEDVDLVKGGTNGDRRDHVQAPGARRLDERDELHLLEDCL